jgi:hypothetical protein
VICEPGSDIRLLVEILREIGLQTLNLEEFPSAYIPVIGPAQEMISKADLVVAVLQETNRPQVYLELGCALGLGRPTAIISTASALPMDLSDLLWIKAPLDDRNALTFQLKAFTANIGNQKPKLPRRPPSSKKPAPQSSKLMSLRLPQSALELEMLHALEASVEIESIVPQPRQDGKRDYIPDFAVWLATGSTAIESPVAIELKEASLQGPRLNLAVEQLTNFARSGDIRTGLIIVRHSDQKSPRVVSLSPLIFVLAYDEAQHLLREGKLVEALRRERNRFAHSAG